MQQRIGIAVLAIAAALAQPAALVAQRAPEVGTRIVVPGSWLDRLPVDDLDALLRFLPGAGDDQLDGSQFRGGSAGFYLNGMPLGLFFETEATPFDPPFGAFDSISVQTSALAAEYGHRGRAVVELGGVATGPGVVEGGVSLESDRFTPDWGSSFTRADAAVRGTVPGLSAASFRFGGTIRGHRFLPTPQELSELPLYLAAGVDTVIGVQSFDGDSLQVAIPEFVPVSGDGVPLGHDDRYDLMAELGHTLGGRGGLSLTLLRSRAQLVERSLTQLYNPDAYQGSTSTATSLLLDAGYALGSRLTLRLQGSMLRQDQNEGYLTSRWRSEHLNPGLGFNLGSNEYVVDPADWPVSDALIAGMRSNVLPVSFFAVAPGAGELAQIQGVPGVPTTLALNPYGVRSFFPTQGVSGLAGGWREQRQVFGRIELDWRPGGGHALRAGAERLDGRTEGRTVGFIQAAGTAWSAEPAASAAWLQDDFAHGAFAARVGLRYESFDAGTSLPRIPGFVFNVPDSLTRDRAVLRPGEEPVLDRIEFPGDCGGAAVCRDNFIPTGTHTTLSPRVALGLQALPALALRASWGRYLQPPPVATIVESAGMDLAGGQIGTTFPQGRDLAPGAVELLELGAAWTPGAWRIDLSAFQQQFRDAAAFRTIPYEDPNSGGPIYLRTLVPVDAPEGRGLDARVERALAGTGRVLFGYSLRDVGENAGGYRPHTLTGIALLDLGSLSRRAWLADAELGITGRVASGYSYTRLVNQGEGTIFPDVFTGPPAERVNASRLPARKQLDLRLAKAVHVAGTRATLYVDARNPFGFTNTHSVFLETGTTANPEHRQGFLNQQLTSALLDGDNLVDDFDIITEGPGGATACAEGGSGGACVNRYMLLQSERRFGDGDAIFTVSEQQRAFGAVYDALLGPQWLREQDRLLRLGVQVEF